MSETNKEYLGKENIVKLFFKLSLPAVIAQIINLLYNIIDRMFIGHIEGIGRDALTGVGVCLPLIVFITAFSALCGMGGAPRASIKMGENKYDEANKILSNNFTLTISLSIILTVVFLIFGKPLLALLGTSDNTLPYAIEYFQIYCIGTMFVMVNMGLNFFVTSQGFSTRAMINVIVGAVCNIILDPILIFGFNLGVKGAALATIISQLVSAILVLTFLFSKKSILRINFKDMALKWNIILPCIALGLSPFIMQSTESILAISFNVSLKKYGGDIAVASMTILISLMQFAMMPLQGFTQGAQPIVSYNFGAKNPDRIKKAFKILFITCLTYSVVFGTLVLTLPQAFAKIFTPDPELIKYSSWAIRIYFMAVFIFGIQVACQQTFIALGKAGISLFLALLRKIILLIPLIYIIPLMMSEENKCLGVFLAEPISDVIAVLTTATMFFIIFRKTLKSIEKPIEDNKNAEAL